MPRNIEPIHTRRAAQLKALAQARNTLPAPDRTMVESLHALDAFQLTDKHLETVGVLADRYLCEVA
jgi:hypothetical protein